MVKRNKHFDAGYIYAPFVPMLENNIKTRWKLFRMNIDPNYGKKRLLKRYPPSTIKAFSKSVITMIDKAVINVIEQSRNKRLKALQKKFLARMRLRYVEDRDEYFCIAEMIIFTPDAEISWNAVAESLVKENYIERHIFENQDDYFSFKIKGLWWCFRNKK